jgi:5'-nucleotidase
MGVFLNVNVPGQDRQSIEGIRLTRQGLRVYRDRLDVRQDPRSRPYYWIGGEVPTGVPEEGSDIGALEDGYVSMTPLQLDLTAYPAINAMKTWQLEIEISFPLMTSDRSNGQ